MRLLQDVTVNIVGIILAGGFLVTGCSRSYESPMWHQLAYAQQRAAQSSPFDIENRITSSSGRPTLRMEADQNNPNSKIFRLDPAKPISSTQISKKPGTAGIPLPSGLLDPIYINQLPRAVPAYRPDVAPIIPIVINPPGNVPHPSRPRKQLPALLPDGTVPRVTGPGQIATLIPNEQRTLGTIPEENPYIINPVQTVVKPQTVSPVTSTDTNTSIEGQALEPDIITKPGGPVANITPMPLPVDSATGTIPEALPAPLPDQDRVDPDNSTNTVRISPEPVTGTPVQPLDTPKSNRNSEESITLVPEPEFDIAPMDTGGKPGPITLPLPSTPTDSLAPGMPGPERDGTIPDHTPGPEKTPVMPVVEETVQPGEIHKGNDDTPEATVDPSVPEPEFDIDPVDTGGKPGPITISPPSTPTGSLAPGMPRQEREKPTLKEQDPARSLPPVSGQTIPSVVERVNTRNEKQLPGINATDEKPVGTSRIMPPENLLPVINEPRNTDVDSPAVELAMTPGGNRHSPVLPSLDQPYIPGLTPLDTRDHLSQVPELNPSDSNPKPEPEEQIDLKSIVRIPEQVRLGWPLPNSTMRGGVSRILNWFPESMDQYTRCCLEFSADDGHAWSVLATGIDGGTAVLWTVPVVTSDTCRLRLVGQDPAGTTRTLITSDIFAVDSWSWQKIDVSGYKDSD